MFIVKNLNPCEWPSDPYGSEECSRPSGQVISTGPTADPGNGPGGAIARPLLSSEAVMRVRPMRPEKTMHHAEYRIEDIAIKAKKAHCPLVDTVSLMSLDASYRSSHWARGCYFGVVTESPAVSQCHWLR